MYLGRAIQGQFLPLPLSTTAKGVVSSTSAAPVVMVFNSVGTKILAKSMPALDLFGTTGLFSLQVRLDSNFPTGQYRAVYNYAGRMKVAHFEVVPGGDANGSIISMYWYERPHASFLVQRLDSDQRVLGRNPR